MMQMIYKNLPNILLVNNYGTGKISLTEIYTSGKGTVVVGATVRVIREPNLRSILWLNVKNWMMIGINYSIN